MKFLVPLVLASLLVACAAPVDPATAHQRKLYEEARANFLALKAQERKKSGPIASAKPAPTVATPAPTLLAKLFPPSRPTPLLKPTPAAKPAPLAKRTAKPASRADGTLYFNPTRLAKPTPTPTPKPTLFARLSQPAKPTPAAKPARTAKSAPPTKKGAVAKPTTASATSRRTLWPKTTRPVNDTIYEWNSNVRDQSQALERSKAGKYRAYEAREARRLGKKPAQLTPEERAWIRARFE